MNSSLPPPGDIESGPEAGTFRLTGAWTTAHLERLRLRLDRSPWPAAGTVRLQAGALEALDTGGAWLLQGLLGELRGRGLQPRLDGLRGEFTALLELVRERLGESIPAAPPPREGTLAWLGREAWRRAEEGLALLAFFGETVVALGRNLRHPGRIRRHALLESLQSAGVNALPILALLSFLIGVVIAYQGGVQLKTYGANIFIVELVTITMLRELAPLMAAIIVAGRTGSAFTAQIGTMRVTEEIDALRTIGIAPMDLLVLPKLFGLVLALPLLTVFADTFGVLGGMTMAALMLDVSFGDFLDRIPQAVSATSFLIGVGKAPVFAAIIALVGCYQGFRVSGGADSVGRQTTKSVVQSIFLVIIADAVFSILYSWLGI